jgi:hypothetical protein
MRPIVSVPDYSNKYKSDWARVPMRTELPIKQEREVDRVENFRNDGSKPSRESIRRVGSRRSSLQDRPELCMFASGASTSAF